MIRTPLSRSKGQGHQAALIGCTGRSTWTYSNGDVHDVSCHHLQAWAGHIVAAARLQLVLCEMGIFKLFSSECRNQSQRVLLFNYPVFNRKVSLTSSLFLLKYLVTICSTIFYNSFCFNYSTRLIEQTRPEWLC